MALMRPSAKLEPAPPTLIEAVLNYAREHGGFRGDSELGKAISREKRIAEARESVIDEARFVEARISDAWGLHDALKHYDEVCNEKV
jgi:hypothetical protein